jgi:glycosyltransferase involved in cell wall biosynthesis
VSRRLKDRYTKSSKKIYYIPNGATAISPRTTDDQDRDTLKAFGLEPKKYILAVGRLVPEKNFDILIEAFIKSNIEGILIIAGSADHKDAYSKTLLDKANNRIRFIGFQKHDILSVLYANASLFVLPSSHEGLPIAALEAAASGCPMVLSDIPANLEIGLPSNNYSRVGDSDQLAEKLRRPSSEFAIDTEAVTSRYEWAAIAQSTSDLYEALASAR